jgi:hypothetical protein
MLKDGFELFVIYDYKNNRLKCFKDSYGVSALFYAINRDSIYFSSVPDVFDKISDPHFKIDINQLFRLSIEGLGVEKEKTLVENVLYLYLKWENEYGKQIT